MSFSHVSVLLQETIEGLHIRPDGIYVDGTLGGGGHAWHVCRQLSEKGRFIGIDQDAAAIAAAGERLAEFGDRVTIVRSNYCEMRRVLEELGIRKVNGIVLDHFIFDHNIKRRVCIITEKEEALRKFIIHELHSGATIYEAIGAYNKEKHNEIITIVDKSEYQKLMAYINREDPKAFITVYNVSHMQYQPKVWE